MERRKIEDKLLQLGVSPSMRGFEFICEAVELAKDESYIKITAIYSIMAKKHGTTSEIVARCIRNAISKMDKEHYEDMGGIGKTNKEVIAMLAFWLKREVDKVE